MEEELKQLEKKINDSKKNKVKEKKLEKKNGDGKDRPPGEVKGEGSGTNTLTPKDAPALPFAHPLPPISKVPVSWLVRMRSLSLSLVSEGAAAGRGGGAHDRAQAAAQGRESISMPSHALSHLFV